MVFIWIAVAVLLLIGEVFTPGFFLFSMAMGAFLAAISALLTESFLIQMAVYIAGLSLSVAFLRPVMNRLFTRKSKNNAERLVGMAVVVEKEIKPGEKGRVKVNGESWLAVSEDNLKVGENAVIEALDGLVLNVRKGSELI